MPGLPWEVTAGQGGQGRGKSPLLPVEAAPLEWNMPEKFLTTDLWLAAASQKAYFMKAVNSTAACASQEMDSTWTHGHTAFV